MQTPQPPLNGPALQHVALQPPEPERLAWSVVWKKLAIWVPALAFLYLTRNFFFVGFMTFLFSYLALAIIGLAMRRLSPGREQPALRRLVTVGVFVLGPLTVIGVAALVGPRLLHEGQQLAGWLGQAKPEMEVARLLEDLVGPAEFKNKYHDPDDLTYKKDLEDFRATKVLHVKAYNDFPNLEAWVEGGFSKQFADAERGRIRSRLMRAGVSSKEFEQWFLTAKLPELQKQAHDQIPDKGRPTGQVDPLVRAAASLKPEQVLDQARSDPASVAVLREEWIQDAVNNSLSAAKTTPAYQADFRKYYDKRVKESPGVIPYTFDQYVELQKLRPQGQVAFGAAVEKMMPSPEGSGQAVLQADFEAAKTHELFQQWWGSSSTAKFIRQELESGESGAGAGVLERILTALLNIPFDLCTALLLSFFICIDFPQLQRGMQRLRGTWLCDVYDEIVPVLSHLGQLVGRSLYAQGLIALCNATMMFFALTVLGIEHAVFLSVVTFVLCLVPTVGTMIAWVLIAAVALVQPGGGLALAVKASGAVVLVVLLETFVFSPRIVGRMMELHPVMMIAILPVAQYFFGIWGLILATPITVYVIHVLILRRNLPGSAAARELAVAKLEPVERPPVHSEG